MKNVLTTFLVTFVALQAFAKIQIPFTKINLKPSYETETLVQTPLAIAPARFAGEVLKDCQEFSITMRNLQDQSVQMNSSDYDDIRLRALPLSMKPSYEIQLVAEKSLNLEPAFEASQIVKYRLDYIFSADALSLKSVQERTQENIVLTDFENKISLQFRSRDLFCDYYFGKLQIVAIAEIQLQTNSNLQSQTEKKLQQVLNQVNESFKVSDNSKVQAAQFGILTYATYKLKWKEILKIIFAELVDEKDLAPKPFWSKKEADYYSLNFSKLHNISEKKIFLKGKFNE